MLSPFPVSPLETPYPISSPPASMKVLHLPTHPLLPPCPGTHLHWGIILIFITHTINVVNYGIFSESSWDDILNKALSQEQQQR